MFGNGTRGRVDKYLDNPHIDGWATNIDFTFAQQWTLDASCVCTRILLYLHTIRNSSVLLYQSPRLWPIPYIQSMVYASRFSGAIWTPFPLSARTFRCSPSRAACAERSGRARALHSQSARLYYSGARDGRGRAARAALREGEERRRSGEEGV